ncbi:MAG: ATP phosphoribosyltransferase [Paludibacteraceae bacterium]|nr:ATP phosphoribosyltransferase [Paludibacteraceae bacterium]
MLRIAVQSKGRLYEETMTMFKEASIKVEENKRTLLVRAKNFPVELLYLRDDDIPQVVAGGVADIGIVGENEYVEKGEQAKIIKRLDFSKCRLSLAIPKSEEYQGPTWFEGKKIATSYPNILRNYLNNVNVNAEIYEITGSVEVSPAIGVADCIFDIVSSGGTLVSNNLKEVEVVMHSEALMIGHPGLEADPEKKAILDELLFRYASYKNAEGKKYIILNIPNDKIEEAKKLLPGMKSPTVTPLLEDGWSSMQSVIAEDCFWERISQLKAIGAEGILVIPIEKMIL